MDIFNGILIIAVIIFIKSYLQEKGKLRALQSENSKLVDQAEKIKSEYSRDLEVLKKDHQLEISKRKYKYESKREQYINFFSLLDSFTKTSNEKIQPRIHWILERFSNEYLAAESLETETAAITNFTLEMQKIIMEANQDIIIIKQQTNSIKLIASMAVLEKIEELNDAFDLAMIDSSKLMQNLSQHMLQENEIGMQEDQSILKESSEVVRKKIEELLYLMRNELDEI